MLPDKKITIAVDGYSSCGKSTLAKALAKSLGYNFIDTGAMYRAVTLYCMRNGLIKDGVPNAEMIVDSLSDIRLDFRINSKTNNSDIYLNDENVEKLIRLPDVAGNVSKVASIKNVRLKLVAEQQLMGINGGVVMDGRDIGSVVFPKAELKLFITASPEIRTERRLKELIAKGIKISENEVASNIRERDHIDSHRKESPLLQTEDAIVIDTSELTPEEQYQIAFDYFKEKTQYISK